jgi:hypothetical protein
MARGHEPDRYTTAEAARLAYLVARGGARLVRKGSPGKWDRKITALQAAAVAREEAERKRR